MGIFEKNKHIDPLYNNLEHYVHKMYRGFWTPAKYEKKILKVDAPHYHNSMTEVEKEAVKRCIMAVAMVEDKVKLFWATLPLDLPQTIVGDVCGVFTQSEVTHRRTYHALAEALGIDTDEIYQYPVAEGRVKYLNKHIEKDPKIIGKKRVLKKLVLFTSLVERASLFTQFYILMSFAKRNKGLKTISAVQQSTATEENIHYGFGMDLINIIKLEYPQLWSEYLVDLISKNLQDAYNAELNLINWIFEQGVPEHLSKKEVINFLNYNFSVICEDLNLNLSFDYDEEMYVEKNEWFTIKTAAPIEGDFFDDGIGGYSSDDSYEDEQIKF